jgi:hypothetical protein
MNSAGRRAHVAYSKSQVTGCKEDPCLEPETRDLKYEIRRGRTARGGQTRAPLKVLWVTI